MVSTNDKGEKQMAKKTFSWGNFSYEFLKAIAYGKETPIKLRPKRLYEEKDIEFLIPYISRICLYPDDYFVRKYRKTIEDYFLNGTNHLIQVVRRLERINYGGVHLGENEDMLFALRQKRMTQTLSDVYLNELRVTGRMVFNDDESIFQVPKILDLEYAEPDKVALFPYQEKAAEAMKQYFIEEDKSSAILSMPTGSGKTRTSVYYLLHDMISQGYQVIWLCHRSMLIEQAAEQFYKFSPIIKEKNDSMKQFKMVCVSGKHASVRALEEDDNLIISSVQSLCNNTVYLPNILGEKVMIVVDEAHHTLAPSYRRIVKAIREKRPDAKLLGLTATPVRLTEKATGQLMKIFDNKIVFSVSMSELIADKILSTPKYVPIDTNIDIETLIDIDERNYISKWGEFPESLVMKVAKTNERNEIIVDEYVKNKEKYGKTIIFALNAVHCDSLNEAFKKRGIRSGYVYTMIGNAENQKTIDRFRHHEDEDGIDVLININILTEGSDIPDIQTVFLTRPTTSDVLLMQMVGRGMRGAGCGGTETVNIVDFCDKWTSITSWLNPKFICGIEDVEDEKIEQKPYKFHLIPMDAIRDIVKGITYKGEFAEIRKSTLPIGWYDVIDEYGNDAKVLVFENQLPGYEAFKRDVEYYLEDNKMTGRKLISKYFKSFGMLPGEGELEDILCYIREEKEFPELKLFDVRDEIEPFALSEKIKQGNMTYTDTMKCIKEAYEQHRVLIESLYGSFDYYKKRVSDCLMFPKGIIPLGTRVEEVDKAVFQLSGEPLSESIEHLLSEVLEENGEALGKGFIRPEIHWTDHPMASYWGLFYHEHNLIYINSLLNSESIDKEVVKFVIYHECLHQEFVGHPKEFRLKERLYKDFQKQEHFLEYILRDFDGDFDY